MVSDLISAYSILLAVYVFLEKSFSDEIEKTLQVEGSIHPEDNLREIKNAKSVRKSKVCALLVLSLVVSLLLAPQTIISIRSMVCKNKVIYDLSNATMVFIEIIFIFIFVRNLSLLWKINNHIKHLENGKALPRGNQN